MRAETHKPIVAPIVTGTFRETPTYASWRAHGTDDYLLIYTVSGSGRFGYVGGEQVVGAGDITLLTPGTLHDYGTARGASHWELLWAHFLPRPTWQDWLRWPEVAPGLATLSLASNEPVRAHVEASLRGMDRFAIGGLTRRAEFARNALETALLWCDTVNPLATPPNRDSRVQKAADLLRERIAEPFSLAELAKQVALSPSRLAHLFKAQVGQTPQQFQERERILRAQQLLALTSRPVATIALEVGFENPFYFTLRFKKHTGLSPRDWRKAADSGRMVQ